MTVTAPLHPEVDFTKLTFLIVDDKAFYRDMAHTALMRAGAKDVKHATTLETAVELLNRHGAYIGCIVCDWDIAPMGGLELLRMIRCKTLPKTPPRTPFIILTGNPNAQAVQSAKAMDVNGFALAPLSFEKLAKTISNGIARQWNLQLPSVYAAVPAVTPSLAAPPKSGDPKRGILLTENKAEADDKGAVGTSAFPRRRAPELKNVHICAVTDIRPGAILARDVLDARGTLLLKTGTELKPNLIDRLTAAVSAPGNDGRVWIGEWDQNPA